MSFAVYVYDSTDDATMNYDRVLVAPEKDAAGSLADLAADLAPVANFPYLSVNLVLARAYATPVPGKPPFLPSLLLELEGVSVGLIGFSNPDIPQLTRPGALGPYRAIDPVEPINTEAGRLRQQGADVIVAMGHMGATGGTLTEPTGPLVDVAEHLEGVDVVVGDHTDVQVSAVQGERDAPG